MDYSEEADRQSGLLRPLCSECKGIEEKILKAEWLIDVKGIDPTVILVSDYAEDPILAKWLIEVKGANQDYYEADQAYYMDNAEVLRWFVFERGMTVSRRILKDGLDMVWDSGNLEMLKLVIEIFKEQIEWRMRRFESFGIDSKHLEMIKWLHEVKEIPINKLTEIGKSSNSEFIDWLIDEQGMDPGVIYEDAVKYNNQDLIGYLE